MKRAVLELPTYVHAALHKHLLAETPEVERAAFVFGRVEYAPHELTFGFVDWLPVGSDGVERESACHVELTDEVRARVIKTAHDLNASIVEFHSHIGSRPAAFSLSDKAGCEEFVPHVWWRLGGRPYAAVVVTASGFDALYWLREPSTPRPLDGIRVRGRILRPTGLTLGYWRNFCP